MSPKHGTRLSKETHISKKKLTGNFCYIKGEKYKLDHLTAHITALQLMSKKTTLEETASVGLQTGRADRVLVLCWAAFGILTQQNHELYRTNDREQNPKAVLREAGP